MNYEETLHKSIIDGITGKSEGIPFPLERLNEAVPGIQKSRIQIIAAGTGVGKSKFINEMYLFNSVDDWVKSGKSYPLHIYYFSLEIPAEQILAAFAIRWIYLTHQILIDSKYLLGYDRENKVDPYIKSIFMSEEFSNALTDFEEAVEIIDTNVNSITFDNFVSEKAKEHGTIVTKEVKFSDGKIVNQFDRYEENDPSQRVMFFIDHIALVRVISGQNKKSMIDTMAEVMIKGRNRYRFSFVIAQQLNRASNSTDRMKLEDMLPKDSDLKDSGGLAEAADLIFGIMSPYRERQNTFLGFRVADTRTNIGLKGRMSVLNVIK